VPTKAIKFSSYLDPEGADRLRNATIFLGGHWTTGALLEQALTRELGRLADDYNDGKPFPRAAAPGYAPDPASAATDPQPMAYPGTTPEIREVLEHVAPTATPVELAPGSTHWRITAADGSFRCTLPLTPSTTRAGDHTRATLRRAGIPLPPGKHHRPKNQRTHPSDPDS